MTDDAANKINAFENKCSGSWAYLQRLIAKQYQNPGGLAEPLLATVKRRTSASFGYLTRA